MKIVNNLRKLVFALKQTALIYKYGGLSTVTIATPDYGNILKDKCVLVTGGSTGIGYAIAKKCVESGAQVIITGRNELRLKDACKKIGDTNCNYLVWDISNVNEIQNNLTKCYKFYGKEINILVNNAGVPPKRFFGNVTEEEWNNIYNINLKGNYFLTQELVKRWKTSPFIGYKKILNISSQGGFVGATYPYRMTKWDIRGLTEGLGKVLIKDNIIVNGIAPGVVKTAMQEFSLKQGNNFYTNQNPINRVCLPEEIAELALFLMSDACNFIIGQTIVCDGGYTLK